MGRSAKISWLIILMLPVVVLGTLGDQELSVDGAKLIWNNNSQTFSIAASGSMSASVSYIWPVADANSGGQALISDASGVLSWGTPTTSAAHNILSVTHDATISAVTVGDIIFGNATPKWDDLAIGASNEILRVSSGLPDWQATTFITQIGTITTGTWQGSTITVPYGGTGAITLTDGGPLLGSGTSAITAMSMLADGEFIVGDGTTDPVAESGNTARTSLGLGTGDSPTFTGLTTDILVIGSNAPATATSAGTEGTITYDTDYIYVCIASNTWERTAIATWAVAAENVIYAGENVIYAAEQVAYP